MSLEFWFQFFYYITFQLKIDDMQQGANKIKGATRCVDNA
jgi:hypothetical protein